LSLPIALALLGTACRSQGPTTIREARFDYNRAIVDTRNEQLLANLVRLRYRDPPYFLEVSSVSTQYVYGGNVAASAQLGEGQVGARGQAGAGVIFEERPTITYVPLQGNDFVTRLLSPVPMEAVVLLAHSGWRADRLLRCCVQRVNGLWNAPSASGPTPDLEPEYRDFVEMAEAMNRLFKARTGELRFQLVEESERGKVYELLLVFDDTRQDTATDLRRMKELLELPQELDTFRLTNNPTMREPDEIGILPRSILGSMSYLAHAVHPPDADVAAGRVTTTLRTDGTPFDWAEVTSGLFAIHSSREQPKNAFVAVQYRGSWFYIDDSDLSSKSTFNLLGQLFELQAGEAGGSVPLLTLPIGG
jgi:hypothetical protein